MMSASTRGKPWRLGSSSLHPRRAPSHGVPMRVTVLRDTLAYLVLVVAAALPGLAQAARDATTTLTPSALPAAFQAPPSWTNPVPPFAIVPGVYYVGTEELAAYLFTSTRGHVLLDAPMEENVAHVISAIRALGFDPHDVRVIVASHGHFDHVGGLAGLREATGAEVVLSARDAQLVGAGGAGDFFLEDRATYPPVPADRVVQDGDTVVVGDIVLTANLTPGHTRGCTSWSSIVRLGEEPVTLVVICSLSVLNGYRLTSVDGKPESYQGIAQDLCSSVRSLRALDADVFLAAHGSFFDLLGKASRVEGDPRAFVDPEGLSRYLDGAERKIEAVLADQGSLGGCASAIGARPD